MLWVSRLMWLRTRDQIIKVTNARTIVLISWKVKRVSTQYSPSRIKKDTTICSDAISPQILASKLASTKPKLLLTNRKCKEYRSIVSWNPLMEAYCYQWPLPCPLPRPPPRLRFPPLPPPWDDIPWKALFTSWFDIPPEPRPLFAETLLTLPVLLLAGRFPLA